MLPFRDDFVGCWSEKLNSGARVSTFPIQERPRNQTMMRTEIALGVPLLTEDKYQAKKSKTFCLFRISHIRVLRRPITLPGFGGCLTPRRNHGWDAGDKSVSPRRFTGTVKNVG